MRRSGGLLVFIALCAAILSSPPALAGFTQQGLKLIGTGAVGSAEQGFSVALSGDGNTAIVGGPLDNANAGAAWVYTRNLAGAWTQQAKLVGSGAVGNAHQGRSVALSADGDTAIVGGYTDDANAGAAWVFVRSAGSWSQQGGKLVGAGAAGKAAQGWSVALAADGSTAIVGGPNDDTLGGAVWIFLRTGGSWSQQGGKLVGTGAAGAAVAQGYAVALAADGDTAIVGGPGDTANAGAVWAFTRSVNSWSQQGGKLVGTGAAGNSQQGWSVAVAADGNTAIVGGPVDNANAGALWAFTRSAGSWTQQGSKLVGTGAVGSAGQGSSVAVAADGNTSIVGAPGDNVVDGAAWVYVRSGGSWAQQGNKLVGTGAVGSAFQGFAVALAGDASTAMVGGYGDNSNVGAAWAFANSIAPPPAPPSLIAAKSRKSHGTAGTFDLSLAATPLNPTTETRAGPTQAIVFEFNKPVTAGAAAMSEGAGTVGSPTFSGNEMTVPLTGVNNPQYVTLNVSGVVANDGGTGGGGSIRIGFLFGDANQSRQVTVADVGIVNAALLQMVTNANFLLDVNVDGRLTVADKGLVNANLLSKLPAP